MEKTQAFEVVRFRRPRDRDVGRSGNGRGRPPADREVLARAAAECHQATGRYFQAGKLVWKGVREAAAKHGIGESTLRAWLAKQ